ncbi:Vacuolar protein sorting-associated protein 13A [Ceratobasidium sp. 428]|nr:Vacuolar protein sorting-associated protein 13A [Ceratobasidium sp. 428]
MRNLSSRPPDQSTNSGSQGPFLSNQPARPPSQGTYSSQIGSTTNVPPLSSEGYVVNRPNDSEHKSGPPATGGYSAPLENTQKDTNDSDTEMTDARSSFDEPQEVMGVSDQDVIQRVPNLFRLLDLVDEQGTGGIVEKMVIDQTSLHRLLNIIQPGSYDSVSKINFKSLDKLSIKATGLYGIRSEIIEYLKKAGCLNNDAATFLLDGVASSTVPLSILRSGLYLVLKPETKLEELSLKQAYIIYWPEESTWDDQAASSSVRRNRITFMRYLIKLTEQIVALVSPDQAKAFVWDTGARNKDLPPDQIDNGDNAPRFFSFEVSKSLEQEEDATASSGFTVRADPKHFPGNANKVETKLVPGEHKAALLVSVHETSSKDHRVFNEIINQMRLRKVIGASENQPQIQLGELSPEGLMCLADNGLREKYREPFQKYERHMRDLNATRSATETQDRRKIDQGIQRDTPMIREEVQQSVRSLYHQVYPSLNVTTSISHDPEASGKVVSSGTKFIFTRSFVVSLHARYPGLSKVEANIQRKHKFDHISDKRFQSLKSKWILIRDYLTAEPLPSETAQDSFVNDVLNSPEGVSPSRPLPPKSPPKRTVIMFGGAVWEAAGAAYTGARNLIGGSYAQDTTPKPKPASLTDPQFVSELRPLQELFPVLREITNQIYDSLRAGLSILEARILGEEVEKIISAERGHLTEVTNRARRDNFRHEESQAFNGLMSELREAMFTSAPHVIYVESLENLGQGNTRSGYVSYRWSGRHAVWRGDRIRHCIYPLALTEQDSQLCQSNEAHVPAPKLESRHKFEFTVDPNRNIQFLQLVRDKCLAVVSEPGKSHIYIDDNLTLDQSINRNSGKITLNHHSLGGPRCLFAFDQATRLLAIVHGEKDLKLSVYIFDEQFNGLRSRGSSVPLKGWYDAEVRIEKVCFVSGKEEVCLIEATGRARIFSLITQQFRSATLQINSPIIDAFSAPDGSCLFITVADQNAQRRPDRLLAFHWASFGSNQKGIHITDLPPSDVARTVTRLEGRGRNYILTFLSTTRSVSSVAVQVKQRATEFSFRSTQHGTQAAAAETFNNSLIDCHLEVWTRFPVVPAVSRCTLVPVSRQPRKIVFQSPAPLPELGGYFARTISTFEHTTRKPMDDSLSAISVVSSVDGEASLNDGVSEFLFGSFIVELLCLIPLHLAITRDNRFIPLKDGVWDPEYERSLLGADVTAIIDALSLGWYESLFQSYMATKANILYYAVLLRNYTNFSCLSSRFELSVLWANRVSVSKSYCLNHFADTSFAGSAMRTTEGVWLSCTPTESYLLVSLDFEGVHSIERSAQEDALLVLFNTAISNLVLFRNNFALSRDIAGLFTSFQSSAMVLDPNANRSLFNSTLAIIIKDVTNSDANDIVKEFSLKFRQIVAKEQDQNFISRLHRGRIQIIPWPVINSPGFYTLFRQLRLKLDEQQFTHGAGGAFLHSLKTLMAKIKVQDWGALDQNLAAHRAQQLLEQLPRALCDGHTEEWPLKNMDTDEELSSGANDTNFFVPKSNGGNDLGNNASVETSLQALIKLRGPTAGARQHVLDRTYVAALQSLIYKGVDQRVEQIRSWTTVNVARFPPGNQDIRNVFSKIDDAASAMRAAVRLCIMTCSNCQLHCLRPYGHSDETHLCGTDHRCVFDCAIAEEHSGREPCSLPAGHSGTHMYELIILAEIHAKTHVHSR